jgi:hypothetical protein
MAIKFEKIEPGMVLLDIHSVRMGNTTMRELGCWPVYIVSVDHEKQTAQVHWNVTFNPLTTWHKHRLERLYREGKEPAAYRRQQERRAKGNRL